MNHWVKVAAVAALGTVGLLSPAAAMASDSQLWTGGSVSVKLSDKWSLSQDLTARFSDNKHGLYELEANTLVGYQLSKSVSLWAGYDHDPQYSGDHFTADIGYMNQHGFVPHGTDTSDNIAYFSVGMKL